VLDAAAAPVREGDAQVVAVAEAVECGGLEVRQERPVGHVVSFVWRSSASTTE
jgi:hypothetical protein